VIDAYLAGAASVLGRERVGVYGGAVIIDHCQAVGSASWFWQTYAWSGGRVCPGIHLYQYQNGQTINGGSVDFTRSMQDNYGQLAPGMAQFSSTPIEKPKEDDMPKNFKTPDTTVFTLGENFGIVWTSTASFSYGANMAAFGDPVSVSMTSDQVVTIVAEANARGAARGAVVSASTPIDYVAVAKAVNDDAARRLAS
jgi:hypothetical protein